MSSCSNVDCILHAADYLLVIVVAVVLSSANVVGYTKCSKQASAQLRDMARNAMTSGLTVSMYCTTHVLSTTRMKYACSRYSEYEADTICVTGGNFSSVDLSQTFLRGPCTTDQLDMQSLQQADAVATTIDPAAIFVYLLILLHFAETFVSKTKLPIVHLTTPVHAAPCTQYQKAIGVP